MNRIPRCDYILLVCVLVLVAVGVVFVYSASYYSAEIAGNKYFYVTKQLVGACVGFVSMMFFRFVKIDFVRKFRIVGVVASAIMLALIFVPGIGVENYGAKRWIGIGGFSFQPSEIAKFAFVLFAASFMAKRDMSKFVNCLPVVGVGVALCGLIIAEPNMSITFCMAMIMLVMLFLSGVKSKFFLMMLAPICLAVPVLIFLEPYRVQRLLAFVDPWSSPKGEGYQLIQSLYALGGGGWFGVGLFNSRQKYRFLPFAESDFIFSVIGEETGIVGSFVVMALFAVVIARGVRIAVNSRNKFDFLLASGITSVIAVQSVVNFAVVTGSIPPTGLPLPFVSYGGTSLVVFMSAVGLLLNLSSKILNGESKWIT